jgi:hypothetical protein
VQFEHRLASVQFATGSIGAERVADMTLADIATHDAGDPQRLGNDVADATARV